MGNHGLVCHDAPRRWAAVLTVAGHAGVLETVKCTSSTGICVEPLGTSLLSLIWRDLVQDFIFLTISSFELPPIKSQESPGRNWRRGLLLVASLSTRGDVLEWRHLLKVYRVRTYLAYSRLLAPPTPKR